MPQRSTQSSLLVVATLLYASITFAAAQAPPPPGFEPAFVVHRARGQTFDESKCCQWYRWCPELKVKHQCHLTALKTCGATPSGWTSEACKACMMCAEAPHMSRIGTNEPYKSANQACVFTTRTRLSQPLSTWSSKTSGYGYTYGQAHQSSTRTYERALGDDTTVNNGTSPHNRNTDGTYHLYRAARYARRLAPGQPPFVVCSEVHLKCLKKYDDTSKSCRTMSGAVGHGTSLLPCMFCKLWARNTGPHTPLTNSYENGSGRLTPNHGTYVYNSNKVKYDPNKGLSVIGGFTKTHSLHSGDGQLSFANAQAGPGATFFGPPLPASSLVRGNANPDAVTMASYP